MTPVVPTGPFDKALSYDASPLAQPLMGSGDISFGVPVYSKAAALMAMVSNYAAAAAGGAAGPAEQQLDALNIGLQYGPVQYLVPTTPPSALQVGDALSTPGLDQPQTRPKSDPMAVLLPCVLGRRAARSQCMLFSHVDGANAAAGSRHI
jgi:hypothetical protein